MKSLFKIYKSSDVEHTQEVYRVGTTKPDLVEQSQSVEVNYSSVKEIFEQAKRDAYNQAQATVRQIIERAEFDRQQVLEAARQQADDMAQKAYTEAYAKGYDKGVLEGIAAKAGEIQRCVDSLGLTIGKIEGNLSGFMAQYESDLKWMALEIASNILKTRIEQDELQLKELVRAAVETVKNAEWIRVELSQQSAELINQLRAELGASQNISIVAASAPPGSCLVETPSGKIDASLSTQLENLKDYFESKSFA